MTDLTARLSAALEGRYRVEREVGEGGMATVFRSAMRTAVSGMLAFMTCYTEGDCPSAS